MPTVTISGGNTSDGTLTIIPATTLLVSRGTSQNPTKVNWVVTAQNVTITNIKKYDSSSDIFSTDPHLKNDNSNNWTGTINSSTPINTEETYYIEWKDASGNSYTFDPSIKINS